ncbi:MAG TPA: STAS domain-containing protein [Candidatus Lustribacter sp.]|nr:STAS domain-containing protein [Candidatus Lustribacter sp.]
MAFAVESLDDVVRVKFRDDLDISRAHDFGKALQYATEADHRPVLIALDASVRYIDSFTLSELLMFRRRLSPSSRRVALHVVNANVFRTLTITDVAERLNASMHEEDALKALRA